MNKLEDVHSALCDAHCVAVGFASEGQSSTEITERRWIADSLSQMAHKVYGQLQPQNADAYFWLGVEAEAL